MIELQRDGQMIRVIIGEEGTISFPNYPGDSTALGIIASLDDYIDRNSDARSVNVRQRGGG